MRSDLVFGATTKLQNRYQLCQLVSKATRKFHRPNTRIQETMNEVIDRFSAAESDEELGMPVASAEVVAETRRRAA
jgi:hypothetical protein